MENLKANDNQQTARANGFVLQPKPACLICAIKRIRDIPMERKE